MPLDLYLAFVVASVALALLPGPNVAIICAHAISYGTRSGLITVIGTTAAMVPQLTLTTLGMSAVLNFASDWFEVLRWLGVAYLLYLGIENWRKPTAEYGPHLPPKPALAVLWRGAIVSLTNPKTLLFFSAFLPQFIDPSADAEAQLALLSLTFLFIGALIDSGWAVLAGRLRDKMKSWTRRANQISGGVLITAAIGMALARKP